MLKLDPLASDLEAIRSLHPLIHNITNLVVMNFTANTLLAVGASPVMAHAQDELKEMVSHANALVLNIGTFDSQWRDSMMAAQQYAKELVKPIVLDPVGAGATRARTQFSLALLERGVDVLRANASEILALAGEVSHTRGVDGTQLSEEAISAAKNLSQQFNCVVVISGSDDYVVLEDTVTKLGFGTPIMRAVTGMGCASTVLIGAFLGVNPDPYFASLHGTALMGIAGQMTADNCDGPGSFSLQLLDTLYQLNRKQLIEFLQ